MNTNNRKYKEPEIYSTTGFKDVPASPVFYSIVTIAFILGISTIFGFLQNPLKFKAVVSVIHQKVSPSSPAKSSITQNVYSLSESFYKRSNRNNINASVSLYLDNTEDFGSKESTGNGIQNVAFNYDVTSNQFWNKLDASSIESVNEEIDRNELEASMFGIPLEPDFQHDSKQIDDSIYVLKI